MCTEHYPDVHAQEVSEFIISDAVPMSVDALHSVACLWNKCQENWLCISCMLRLPQRHLCPKLELLSAHSEERHAPSCVISLRTTSQGLTHHEASKSIDFTDQGPLCQAPHAGIAAHLSHTGGWRRCDQYGMSPAPGCRCCRFTT